MWPLDAAWVHDGYRRIETAFPPAWGSGLQRPCHKCDVFQGPDGAAPPTVTSAASARELAACPCIIPHGPYPVTVNAEDWRTIACRHARDWSREPFRSTRRQNPAERVSSKGRLRAMLQTVQFVRSAELDRAGTSSSRADTITTAATSMSGSSRLSSSTMSVLPSAVSRVR